MKVFDNETRFIIQDGTYHEIVYAQRKESARATDSPLAGYEKTILALCREVLRLESATPPEAATNLRPGLEAVQTYLRGAIQTSRPAADVLDNLEAFIVNELQSRGPSG